MPLKLIVKSWLKFILDNDSNKKSIILEKQKTFSILFLITTQKAKTIKMSSVHSNISKIFFLNIHGSASLSN